MNKIEWKTHYNTGIKEIDEQHQRFVEIINKLFEAKESKEEERAAIKQALIDIVNYTKFHFESEEKHMNQNDYDKLHEHKAQHNILKKQLTAILEDLKNGKIEIGYKLRTILQNWLIRHILDHDIEYAHFIKNH